MTDAPLPEGGAAGRVSIDRSSFRGLPPTVRDAKGRVRHPALTDELTELPNRVHFDVVYRLLWEAGGRGIPVALILFELPAFGAAAAEGQLRVGRRFNEITRQMDMVARLEGDRVGALLVNCNAFGGLIAAERFQTELSQILGELGISFGAGIAAWKDWMTNPDDLMQASKEALAAARSSGRIEVHSS